MNKKLSVFIITIMMGIIGILLFNIKSKPTLSASDDLRTKYENAIVETAYQYYYRGKNIQYDSINLNYEINSNRKNRSNFISYLSSSSIKNKNVHKTIINGFYSPEDVSSQDIHYFVCSHFTSTVYAQTFADKNNKDINNMYFLKDKNGDLSNDVGDVINIIDPDSKHCREDANKIKIYYKKFTNKPTTKEKDKLISLIDDLRPGDLVARVYKKTNSNGEVIKSSGHIMLYIGNGKIMHSTGNAPSQYSKIGTAINNTGVSTNKYHYESKADIIETPSGHLDLSDNKGGTVLTKDLKKVFEKYLNSELNYDNNEFQKIAIIRPLNEIVNNKNISLSSNTTNRMKTPKLVIEKTSSVEKYESVNLGQNIEYTIKLQNKSNSNYKNILVNEEVPKYTEIKKSSLQSGCSLSNNTIKCKVNVGKGDSKKISYTVVVTNNAKNIGNVIENKNGTVNGIPTKNIKTVINKTLTKDDRENLVSKAKELVKKNKKQTISKFIKNVYSGIGYDNLIVYEPNKVFESLFTTSNYKIPNGNTFLIKNVQESPNASKTIYTQLKYENLKTNVAKKISKTVVEGLTGGLYVKLLTDDGRYHERNSTFTNKTLMVGDILYVCDEYYGNDNISKDGGYIATNNKYSAYLYLGNGEFVTIKDGKPYLYSNTNIFNYYWYNTKRSSFTYNNKTVKKVKVDTKDSDNPNDISMGQRLLISLLAQDAFVVIRPSYAIEEKIDKIDVTKNPTKMTYIQNKEDIELKGGKLKITYKNGGYNIIDLDSPGVTVSNFDNSKKGDAKVIINYKGVKTTITVNVVAKSVSKIKIKINPNKLEYIEGNNLDLTGGLLEVVYNDKTTNEVKMTSSKVKTSGYNSSKIGKQTVTIDYLGKTTTYNVNVIAKKITSVVLSKKPNKLKYKEKKEILDLTGGIITIKYNDNTIKEIKLPNKSVTSSGFDNSKVGIQKITLTYQKKTMTFDIEITKKNLSSISINKSPSKIKYIQKEEQLDLTDGTIKLLYDNDSTGTVKMTSPNVKVSGFDNSKIGSQTITVEYLGKKTTFTVEIIEKSKRKLNSIELNKLPNKTIYNQNVEQLDLTGGSILIKYSDNTTETISMTSSNIKVSGFDNSKVGTNKITITYLGKSISFNVTIKKRSVTGISIKTKPDKLLYIENSEQLDLTGGTIKVTYSDKNTSIIEMTSSSIKVSGYDNTKIGNQTITINYLGKKATFTINVMPKDITNIVLSKVPTKINYKEYRDKLDLTGGIITVNYNDNTKKQIKLPSDEVSVSGFDNTKIGISRIFLKYHNKEVTYDVNIIEKKLVRIDIDKLPTKLKYIQNKEKLDLSSGSIKLTYDNNTTEIIKLKSPNVKIENFDNTKTGKNKVKVLYLDKITSFDIDIIAENKRIITSISINKLPNKKTYSLNKDKLDLNGGSIKAKYSDNTTEIISMESPNIKATGFDNTTEGKKKITITYANKKTSFTINIKNRQTKKVKIVKQPTKSNYNEDEKLDLNGGVVEIEYTDKTKEKTNLPSPNIDVIEPNENSDDTVIISYDKKSDTFKVKGFSDVAFEEEYEDDVDFSDYGVFYDAVKMKPKDVKTSIIIIVVISVLMFMFVVKPKKQ